MRPSDLLHKALAAGPVRKLDTPAMTKVADVSFKYLSPKARTEALATLARQKAALADIAKRIERLEARDRLAKADTSGLRRA